LRLPHGGLARGDPILNKGGMEVGTKVRLIQVFIILSALAGLFALQSTRSRQGVLCGANTLKT